MPDARCRADANIRRRARGSWNASLHGPGTVTGRTDYSSQRHLFSWSGALRNGHRLPPVSPGDRHALDRRDIARDTTIATRDQYAIESCSGKRDSQGSRQGSGTSISVRQGTASGSGEGPFHLSAAGHAFLDIRELVEIPSRSYLGSCVRSCRRSRNRAYAHAAASGAGPYYDRGFAVSVSDLA